MSAAADRWAAHPAGTPEMRRAWAADAHRAARAIHVAIRARVRHWTRGNNSGDPAALEAEEAAAAAWTRRAEHVAGLYGCRLTWPGLYPTMQTPDGFEHLLGPLGEERTERLLRAAEVRR